jgi:hypothetical protein
LWIDNRETLSAILNARKYGTLLSSTRRLKAVGRRAGSVQKLGAGDRTRTRDVQLGKLAIDCKYKL